MNCLYLPLAHKRRRLWTKIYLQKLKRLKFIFNVVSEPMHCFKLYRIYYFLGLVLGNVGSILVPNQGSRGVPCTGNGEV